jgi:3-hydroxy acid dehydrogenase / malonic semialdehyde reductase
MGKRAGASKMKWVFITGATSGIGKETAYLLAEKKFNLFLVARREERLITIQQDLIARFSIECKILVLDLCDITSTEKELEKNRLDLEKVDILINNAGIALGVEPLDQLPFSSLQKMIDTNITALLFLCHFFIPFFKRKGSGQIINIGSVAGRLVYPGGTTYCATKFAVRAISEGLRMDLLGSNIRVNNIEPGMVETEFSLVRLGDIEKAKKVYEGMVPLSGHDIAETIFWVINLPSHVNIQEIIIYPTAQASIGQVARSHS